MASFSVLSVRGMTYDGSDLQPASHLLGELHGHLHGVAGGGEFFEERRRHVLCEHPPVPETPEVELHRLRLQESPPGSVAQFELVEIRLAGDRTERGQLVRRKLYDRIRAVVFPRHRVQLLRSYGTPCLAPQYPFVFLLHHPSSLLRSLSFSIDGNPRAPISLRRLPQGGFEVSSQQTGYDGGAWYASCAAKGGLRGGV